MTPHQEALDAAWKAMHKPGSEDMMTACIKAYMKTFLGDERIAHVIRDAIAENDCRIIDSSHAIIKALLEEV